MPDCIKSRSVISGVKHGEGRIRRYPDMISPLRICFMDFVRTLREKRRQITEESIDDVDCFLLLQARSRSSVSLRAATGGSRTAQTGRSIHTFTRRTSPTTVGCLAATRATHILARCGST
jgi:hypothetical protein